MESLANFLGDSMDASACGFIFFRFFALFLFGFIGKALDHKSNFFRIGRLNGYGFGFDASP